MVNEAPFAAIRKAHRYVVAYQRRVLDAMSQLDAALVERELSFRKWKCIHHSGPCRQATRPFAGSMWAWDMVPLHGVVFEWGPDGDDERKKGSVFVFVEHVADTAFEEHVVAGNAEPDPLDYVDADGQTLFRAHWIKLLRAPTDAEWAKSWETFVKSSFGVPSVGELWPLLAATAPVSRENESILVGGFAVRAEDVSAPDGFRTGFIEPLVQQVTALLP